MIGHGQDLDHDTIIINSNDTYLVDMASVSLNELSRDTVSMLILYVLGKMDDGALKETHFQKAMFRAMLILGYDPREAGYRPHFYGPYSDLMTEKKTSLLDIGYLEISGSGVRVNPDEKAVVSRITLPGKDTDSEIADMIASIEELTVDEVLLITYCDDERKTKGKFIDESHIKADIYRNRIPLAIGLYRKRRVTLDRGAELAGLSVHAFQDELIERFGNAHVD